MAGTKAGGQAAAATNKVLYGEDYYSRIGSRGGTTTHISGKLAMVSFANDKRSLLDRLRRKPTRAQLAGRKGGAISKRGHKVVAVAVAEPPVKVAPAPKPKGRPGGYYKPVVSVIPPHNTFYVYIFDKEK